MTLTLFTMLQNRIPSTHSRRFTRASDTSATTFCFRASSGTPLRGAPRCTSSLCSMSRAYRLPSQKVFQSLWWCPDRFCTSLGATLPQEDSIVRCSSLNSHRLDAPWVTSKYFLCGRFHTSPQKFSFFLKIFFLFFFRKNFFSILISSKFFPSF